MSAFAKDFSRRDFLKLAALGFWGLFFPFGKAKARETTGLPSDQQGRVARRSTRLFDAPDFKAIPTKEYWQDILLPITDICISEDLLAYNRVWYQIGEEGYAYSGDIQPVRTVLNRPIRVHPKEGSLAEVTVPYTDARKKPRKDASIVYRLYYQTTHWIVATLVDESDQTLWYQLRDDKEQGEYYYVIAAHLRIIRPNELTPISANLPNYKKSIEVRLSQQLVVAYEGLTPVFAARASTGKRRYDGSYYTPQGVFKTYYKRPSRHMAAGNLANNGYDLPGVPWVVYLTKGGISFHGTYWHNDYGTPHSHGCINLSPQAAKWLYRWTSPVVKPEREYVYGFSGTHVEIIK